jgi:hypothetical protein
MTTLNNCKLTDKTQIELVKVLNGMVKRYNSLEIGLNFTELRDFENYLTVDQKINLERVNKLINL